MEVMSKDKVKSSRQGFILIVNPVIHRAKTKVVRWRRMMDNVGKRVKGSLPKSIIKELI